MSAEKSPSEMPKRQPSPVAGAKKPSPTKSPVHHTQATAISHKSAPGAPVGRKKSVSARNPQPQQPQADAGLAKSESDSKLARRKSTFAKGSQPQQPQADAGPAKSEFASKSARRKSSFAKGSQPQQPQADAGPAKSEFASKSARRKSSFAKGSQPQQPQADAGPAKSEFASKSARRKSSFAKGSQPQQPQADAGPAKSEFASKSARRKSSFAKGSQPQQPQADAGPAKSESDTKLARRKSTFAKGSQPQQPQADAGPAKSEFASKSARRKSSFAKGSQPQQPQADAGPAKSESDTKLARRKSTFAKGSQPQQPQADAGPAKSESDSKLARRKSTFAKGSQPQQLQADAGPAKSEYASKLARRKSTFAKGPQPQEPEADAGLAKESASKLARKMPVKSTEKSVIAGARKGVPAGSSIKKSVSAKSPESNQPATSGKRKSITGAAASSKLTSPKSPEEHLTSPIRNKSSAEIEKSETVRKKQPDSRKASRVSGIMLPAAASQSGGEGANPNKAAAQEAEGADQRKRKRRKKFVPRVLTKQASRIIGTATALIPLGLAEKKLHAASSDEDEDGSGQSGLESHQQHCLALVGALACTIALLVALTIAVYYGRSDPENVKVACITAERLDARRFVDSLLDTSKDRCKDFYGYVCNRWQQKGSSFARDMEDQLIGVLHERLKEDVQVADPQGGHLMAHVYRGCHTYVGSKERLGSALSFTEDVVMSGRMRRASSFREVVSLVARASLEIGLHTVLNMRIEAAGEGSSRLRISPGKSILRKIDVDNYDDLRRVLDTTFDWLPNVYTRDSVVQVIESDRSVEDALAPRGYGDSQPVAENVAGPLARFVNGMAPGMGAEAWRLAVNDALPQHLKIDPQAVVRADAPTVFWSAFTALSLTGLRKTRFYLGANLDAEVAYLETSRERVGSGGVNKAARFCLELCRRIRSLSWHELIRGLLYDQGIIDTANRAREVFASLVRTVIDKKALTWLPDDVREEAFKMAFELQVDVIQANAISEVAIDVSHFSPPPMDNPRAFVFGFLDVIKADNKMLLGVPPTHRDTVLQRAEPYGPVSYESELGSVLIPSLYMSRPYLYGAGVPMYFNYGTIGVLLATAIAQAIIKGPEPTSVVSDEAATSTSSPAATSWWTTKMREKRNQSISCLEELRQRLGFATSSNETSLSAHGEDDTLFAWASGLQLAYHALHKRFVEIPGAEEGYWHSAQRTFFVRSCMLWCSSAGSETGGLSPREHCLLPLQDFAPFADVYSCDVQGADYVQGKCEV